jgi:G3E family GTPase
VPHALLERFLGLLVELRGAGLLRVKGVVAVEDGQRVLVQGVRHVFDRLRPVALPETGLVFVADRVEKSEVQALWQAMSKLKGPQ